MNYSTRYDQRKKRRLNRLLNVAIGIVAILIIYVAVKVFFTPGGSEEVIADLEQEQQQEEQSTETEQTIENDRDIDSSQEEAENEEIREEEEEAEEELSDGEWQPIGTVQSEPFTIDFTRDSVNWKEMTHAIQYATGLDDDMTIWRIENGGDAMSAIGTVSDKNNRNTPYRVRIEWVPERGWKPVEVIKLSSNPYL
ncbi:YrrS family protein [Alkalihalobacterium chitinilyticum]|uniref:YrrS family protein n=1 Tax=Alkalihalobacterium chitinilyticum TaxID=2980103 RepID=A0ABT5VE70_9BACI|nr:YrrS family protein [Alkalihalobacterium chitinilyticum]MDE5413751.1 YrrS family protein [Alkalihalobacterium chitinilyticum]